MLSEVVIIFPESSLAMAIRWYLVVHISGVPIKLLESGTKNIQKGIEMPQFTWKWRTIIASTGPKGSLEVARTTNYTVRANTPASLVVESSCPTPSVFHEDTWRYCTNRISVIISSNGSVSKPCTPVVHIKIMSTPDFAKPWFID